MAKFEVTVRQEEIPRMMKNEGYIVTGSIEGRTVTIDRILYRQIVQGRRGKGKFENWEEPPDMAAYIANFQRRLGAAFAEYLIP